VVKDSEFLQLIKKHGSSNKIRFYFIYKNKHYFIDNGRFKSGFSSKIVITKNRDKIMSGFSKMGFLFDEIIRMRIVGYSDKKNSDELLYALNLIPLNRKIRTLLDWKVFPPEYTRDMSRLFEVRNALNHAVSIDDVNYTPNKEVSLSSQAGFRKFKVDFERSWKKLLQVYAEEQKPVYLQLEKLLAP
jgi:hypothetical protein